MVAFHLRPVFVIIVGVGTQSSFRAFSSIQSVSEVVIRARPLKYGCIEDFGSMPYMAVPVARVAAQGVLPCRVLAPADAVGHPVHPIKWYFESDQVLARPDIRSVTVRVVDIV